MVPLRAPLDFFGNQPISAAEINAMAWKRKCTPLDPSMWETVYESSKLRVLSSKARAGNGCYVKVETKRPRRRFGFCWNGRELTGNRELLRCEHDFPGTVAEVEHILIEKGYGKTEEPPKKKGPPRATLDPARWSQLSTDEGFVLYVDRASGSEWTNLILDTPERRFRLAWNGERFAHTAAMEALSLEQAERITRILKEDAIAAMFGRARP
jgi:hypothetical protein